VGNRATDLRGRRLAHAPVIAGTILVAAVSLDHYLTVVGYAFILGDTIIDPTHISFSCPFFPLML
jgi:hypothetical protein